MVNINRINMLVLKDRNNSQLLLSFTDANNLQCKETNFNDKFYLGKDSKTAPILWLDGKFKNTEKIQKKAYRYRYGIDTEEDLLSVLSNIEVTK